VAKRCTRRARDHPPDSCLRRPCGPWRRSESERAETPGAPKPRGILLLEMPAGEAAGVQRGRTGPWGKQGRGESWPAPSGGARRRPLALGPLLVCWLRRRLWKPQRSRPLSWVVRPPEA
jgi:hypothetical protein